MEFLKLELAIERLKIGEKEGFEVIIDEYQDRIRTLIALRGVHSSDVDTIAQDVFIHVYKNILDYQADTDFKAWIQSIARFKCLQWQEARTRELKNKNKVLEVYLNQESIRLNQELSIQHEQSMMDKMEDCFNQLNEDLQFMLKERYSGISIQKIANDLNRGESAIKMSLLRARNKLKGCIQGI